MQIRILRNVAICLGCLAFTYVLADTRTADDVDLNTLVIKNIMSQPMDKDSKANIAISTHQSVVWLKGCVTSEKIKTNAESLALNTPGVEKVINRIVVKANCQS